MRFSAGNRTQFLVRLPLGVLKSPDFPGFFYTENSIRPAFRADSAIANKGVMSNWGPNWPRVIESNADRLLQEAAGRMFCMRSAMELIRSFVAIAKE